MKPSKMILRGAALALGAVMLFGSATASAPGPMGGLERRQVAATLAARPASGGFVTLASKSKPKKSKKDKKTQKQRRAAKHRAQVAQKKAKRVIAVAKAKLGKPYSTAGDGPDSFDCSGFTVFAYRSVGVALNHYAKSQGYGRGGRVSRSKLRRGDLVFLNTSERKGVVRYHVGVYLGSGKFIHASSSAKKVIISSISYGFYKSAFLWGKRLF